MRRAGAPATDAAGVPDYPQTVWRLSQPGTAFPVGEQLEILLKTERPAEFADGSMVLPILGELNHQTRRIVQPRDLADAVLYLK